MITTWKALLNVIFQNVTVCNFCLKKNILLFSVKREMLILFFVNCERTVLFSVKRVLDPPPPPLPPSSDACNAGYSEPFAPCATPGGPLVMHDGITSFFLFQSHWRRFGVFAVLKLGCSFVYVHT